MSETAPVADLRRERTATDGFGAYWRDGAGTWRYAGDDEPVTGAVDLQLRDLFAPAEAEVDGRRVRIVPRAWASRHPDHPLAWAFEHAELGGREPIAVPADEWAAHEDDVAGMAAPELHPVNLMGVDGVARLLGVTAATVRSYLARGQMPPPTWRIGGSPVWSRPLIERWIPTRRVRRSVPPPDPDTTVAEPD